MSGPISITGIPVNVSGPVTLGSTTATLSGVLVTVTPLSNPVAVPINGGTYSVSGINFNYLNMTVPQTTIPINCNCGDVTVNGSMTGNSVCVNVTLASDTDDATDTGTITNNLRASGSASLTGCGTINLGTQTGAGYVSIPSLSVSCSGSVTDISNLCASGAATLTGQTNSICVSGSVTGTIQGSVPICVDVSGTVKIPSTPVTGLIEDVQLQTTTDLSAGNFTFIGTHCTFNFEIEYSDVICEHTYSICVCWRQLFVEAEAGKTVCAVGGTPCTCPQDCDEDAICKPKTIWDFPCHFCGGGTGCGGGGGSVGSGSANPLTVQNYVVCDAQLCVDNSKDPPIYAVSGTPCNPAIQVGVPCKCS